MPELREQQREFDLRERVRSPKCARRGRLERPEDGLVSEVEATPKEEVALLVSCRRDEQGRRVVAS